MTHPKISVLTPLYNTKPIQLRAMIESILGQTYEDFEFLILNDSPENTEIEKIVKSYNDSRIKFFVNEYNMGITKSRNKLINMATGEYLAVVDHDDISMPKRFELEAEFLALFESFENPQSITVREMNTEFVFAYNPNKRIACASAIKAPFSLFITKCIEQGLVSWDERLVYEKKYDYFTGSGVIQESYDYGTKFSVKRLYELMLYVSDNIAYLMLKDRFGGASKFNDAINALGCNDIIDWGNWGNLTSYEMALVWREIYYYTQSGSSQSKKLYKELDRALYNELEKGIKNKDNLHKSGWSANGYNDAGVFFDGELVYSVAVMTGRKELTDKRNATHLIKVAKLIDKLMAEYKEYTEALTEDDNTSSKDVEYSSEDVEASSEDVFVSQDVETSMDSELSSQDVETATDDAPTQE
jgi:glycosyltransferase involved in cell wall biosynthesis